MKIKTFLIVGLLLLIGCTSPSSPELKAEVELLNWNVKSQTNEFHRVFVVYNIKNDTFKDINSFDIFFKASDSAGITEQVSTSRDTLLVGGRTYKFSTTLSITRNLADIANVEIDDWKLYE